MTNSQLLSTQLSTMQDRTDPKNDPTIAPQLLLLMLPGIHVYNYKMIMVISIEGNWRTLNLTKPLSKLKFGDLKAQHHRYACVDQI